MKTKKINSHYLFIVLFMVILLTMPFSVNAQTKENNKSSFFNKGFYIDLMMNGMYPFDSDFRDVYKSFVIYPEIGAGYILSEKIYVFGNFGFYNLEGTTPEWDFTVKMDQKIISAGGGYLKQLSDKIGASAELGLTYVTYTEELEVMEIENSDNCIGFFIGGKGYYSISELLNLVLKVKYSTISEDIEDVSVNFGGLNFGFGLMLTF